MWLSLGRDGYDCSVTCYNYMQCMHAPWPSCLTALSVTAIHALAHSTSSRCLKACADIPGAIHMLMPLMMLLTMQQPHVHQPWRLDRYNPFLHS